VLGSTGSGFYGFWVLQVRVLGCGLAPSRGANPRTREPEPENPNP
jgi:hypothetical protein